jgi:hypothetical protein
MEAIDMPPRIDHFSLGARNIYEGADRLRTETGLDSYDSGWMPGMGVAHRTVPLGEQTYIEIESVIDYETAIKHFFGKWFEAVLADAKRADRFMGWVIAVDTLDELQAIADRIGYPIAPNGATVPGDGSGEELEATWDRRMLGGHSRHFADNVPNDREHRWPRGLPMFMVWNDKYTDHPDTIPEASSVKHRVHPRGIAWVEVGDESLTRPWLGPEGEALDIRYVDRPAGLYAVGIRSDEGEIVIRRDPAPVSLAVHYQP